MRALVKAFLLVATLVASSTSFVLQSTQQQTTSNRVVVQESRIAPVSRTSVIHEQPSQLWTTTTLPASISGDDYFDPNKKSGLQKLKERFLPGHETSNLVRRAEKDRVRHRKQMEKEAKQVLREFPWPFRMFGNAMTSGISKAVQKEGHKLDRYLNQAQKLLAKDSTAVAVLGAPIVVGNEISHSSSSVLVHGQKTHRVQAFFQVRGSQRSDGMGYLVADQRKVLELKVTVGGRTIVIDT